MEALRASLYKQFITTVQMLTVLEAHHAMCESRNEAQTICQGNNVGFLCSSTKFPCSSSPLYHDDLYPQNSSHPIQVGLLQTKLNKVLDKDYRKWTMRVQPGIRYTELLKEAQKAGMSIQVGRVKAALLGLIPVVLLHA